MVSVSLTLGESATFTEALRKAARLWGVEYEFWDIWGNLHTASEPVLQAILGSLGVDTSSRESVDHAIGQKLWEEWSTPLPPALVLSREMNPLQFPLVLPAHSSSETVTVRIDLEEGLPLETAIDLSTLPVESQVTLRDETFVRKLVPLPGAAPLGYHRLVVHTPSGMASSALILCPDRMHQPEAGRTAGIGISLYGLRSGRNWGCGDLSDLRAFTDWAIDHTGVDFIALNPLHAIPNRQPYNTSPYLPNCSYFRNLLYLDVEAVDARAAGIAAHPKLQAEISALRESEFVEYERVQRLKLRVLRILFRYFLREYRSGAGLAPDFSRFLESEGKLLDDFAVHCALDECIHKQNPDVWNWPAWPREYQEPDSEPTRAFATQHWRSVLFYKFIQFHLDRQLDAAMRHARDRGMTIGLYHDVALATDRFGCDLWANRRFYVNGCRVGSPPDNFAPKGQDWAFPPPNTIEHARDGYRLFAESIRRNSRHGGALRIDHVMRFFHLFWIPDGMEAADGAYVQDRHEDLLHILALESVRNRFVVIGEDLGTVPDSVRDSLARFGVLSYRLLYFEQDRERQFKLPFEYPAQALVSISTHDLPTIAGFWQHRDIDARRAVGIIPDDDSYRAQISGRVHEKQILLDVLFRLNLLPASVPRNAAAIPVLTGDLHAAIVQFLGSTPSQLMLLNQEDLFKETEQQNLPGTTAQYPNWRRKMRYQIEELGNSPAADFARMFRSCLRNTGRISLEPATRNSL